MLLEVEIFRVFLLVMVRLSGLVLTAPVLGSANFPLRAKIGLVVFTAFLVTPGVMALPESLPAEPVAFSMMAAGELLIGLMMGFVMTLTFAAVQVAGQVIDMMSGFALMNVFNPALETQVPIFGFFYFLVGALYLLVLDLHQVMLLALVRSFEVVRLGGFVARPAILREVSDWGSQMFLDGLLIAAPVAGALLLAYMTMGLLSRVVPQIHLFVVGFPLTIALSLFVIALSLWAYLHALDGMFDRMFQNVEMLVRGIG